MSMIRYLFFYEYQSLIINDFMDMHLNIHGFVSMSIHGLAKDSLSRDWRVKFLVGWNAQPGQWFARIMLARISLSHAACNLSGSLLFTSYISITGVLKYKTVVKAVCVILGMGMKWNFVALDNHSVMLLRDRLLRCHRNSFYNWPIKTCIPISKVSFSFLTILLKISVFIPSTVACAAREG